MRFQAGTLSISLFQGFDGLPIAKSTYVNHSSYYEVTAFIGVTAIGLAVLGLMVNWRHIKTVAIGLLVLAELVLIFLQPLLSAVDAIPHANGVNWYRGLIPASFGIAVLADQALMHCWIWDRRRPFNESWLWFGLVWELS